MHIIQMLKNSMQFTLGMPFLGVLGYFTRILKGLTGYFIFIVLYLSFKMTKNILILEGDHK